MNSIYLDHNATTPLRPEAWEAMRPALEAFGNPSSAHHAGKKARQLLEGARERIAALLGAKADEVTFTSGATEANNLAIFGLAGEPPATILTSALEHPCVIEPVKQLERRGFAINWLPVTPRGQVEQRAILERITDQIRLVCLMYANHETGAIQPVRHVAKTLPKSIAFHCDAAQAVGKMPIDFRDLGMTTLSVSAHKFGGPKGVGVLLVRSGTKLTPQLHGGHQQAGRRPGTEPVALALGMAAALDLAVHEMDANRKKLDALRTRLLQRLQAEVPPVIVNGPGQETGEGRQGTRDKRQEREQGDGSSLVSPVSPLLSSDGLPTTLNLSFPGCRSDLLLVSLDLAGIACSTGSACSSGSLLPSPVLKSMAVPDEILRSAIRFSIGPTLTDGKIDDAAERIIRCVKNLRTLAASP